MIFSKQLAAEAMSVIGNQFNKILAVDFQDDEFLPVKVSEEDWKEIQKYEEEAGHTASFTEWIGMFIESENSKELYEFPSCSELLELKAPATFCYKKKINGEFHDVRMEIIPVGDVQGYLYVIDMTEINHTKLNCNKENCTECGKC